MDTVTKFAIWRFERDNLENRVKYPDFFSLPEPAQMAFKTEAMLYLHSPAELWPKDMVEVLREFNDDMG